MAIDDRAFRYFRIVHASGSIRAAARRMRIAPSAISRQITELEAELGLALVERTARGVRLTEAGSILARYAREHSDLGVRLSEDLDALRGLTRGTVHIGTGEGFLHDLVANGLGLFMTRYPGIHVQLSVGATQALRDGVLGDEFDLAAIYHVPHHHGLEVIAEASHPLTVIAARGHPLAHEGPPVTPEMLGETPMAIMAEGFGLRALIDEIQRDHGVTFNVRLTTDAIQALQAFALTGIGVAIAPAFVVAQHLAGGHLVARPLESDRVTGASAKLVVRRGRPLSHATRRLAECLREAMVAVGGGQPPGTVLL